MEEGNLNNNEAPIVSENKSSSRGGLIGAIIIIVILIIGGWYFIGGKVKENTKEIPVNIGVTTGSSTEVNDIQTDLDNLNLNVLND